MLLPIIIYSFCLLSILRLYLFKARNAVKFGFLRQDANARGWILWAMDWRGFSGPDIPLLARLMLYDAGSRTVNDIEASIVQGFCSKLAGRYITRYLLQQQRGFLQLPPHMKFSYKFLPAYYIGDSMGSILGGGYTAFTGYERSVFFVAGSPFTFLITRSDLFATFSVLFGFQLYNRVDMRIIISTFQLLFDAAETSGWSQSGVYNKTSSLTEIALGDSTVSTVSGRIFGYNLHAKLLSPVLFPIYGIPERHTNSSTVIDTNTPPGQHIFVEGIFTADAASIPKTNEIPPNPTQVHYCLDSLVLSVQKQVAEYISTGKITNNCPNNGICVYGNTASC